MSSQLDRYQEISALSARMVDAARTGDWDGLVVLERRVAEIRDRLMSAPVGSLSEPARIHDLIQRILADDAEVRRHTEPWMEQVRLLLSGHVNGWHVDIAQATSESNSSGRGLGL